jgi:hypothetical protein
LNDFNAPFNADVLRVTAPRSEQQPQRGDIFVVWRFKQIQAPSGAAYFAPTGLENFVGGSSTKIPLLTELGALAAVCKEPQPPPDIPCVMEMAKNSG